MSDRDELVEAGAQALHAPWQGRDWIAASKVIDAVESLIRADEREQNKAEVDGTAKWCREDERATLRARVEAIGMYSTFGPDGSLDGSDVILRSDVLALLDGGSDG